MLENPFIANFVVARVLYLLDILSLPKRRKFGFCLCLLFLSCGKRVLWIEKHELILVFLFYYGLIAVDD